MYETVLRHISYNYDIPKDIIQLIYNELNRKHYCAIIIQDEIKKLKAEKPRGLCGIKYFMIEPIYDEGHCFINNSINNRSIVMPREMYNGQFNIYNDKYIEIKEVYRLYSKYRKIILENGFKLEGFFKDYKNEYNINIIYV